ncbi:MAG: NAD(P)-dependent oxidoreductase [Solirubrobacteraceae bacterium]|nr:NAD(P)-dependent oxidoreductase [Solirubrobacteraceae bacterium]
MEGQPDAATRIGFYGLGIMGSRMAANLARAGFALTVATHTPGKAEAWAAEHGAATAATPAELAAQCDVLITMVVDGDQVREVLLGADGAAHGAGNRPHTPLLCLDMSTIPPAETVAIGGELAAAGVQFVDAPVTGSSPRAEDGTLTIMCGGRTEDVERARPVLDAMGSLIVHVGPLGKGEALKVINNAMAAANAAVVAEALVAASAAGVDLDAFEQVVGAGSGGSMMFTLKAGPMRRHDYATLFKLAHMRKDVDFCLDAAAASGVPFESAQHARDLLAEAGARGFENADFAALLEAVEQRANRRV